MDKYSLLKKYFGYSQFRQGQEEIIDAILDSRDVLGVMPTGAGKSLCYQIPALMLDGLTVVISPLISLMKDQVSNLVQAGIETSFINSTQDHSEQMAVFDMIRYGKIKIVYVAPERLMAPSFLTLCQNVHISMVTVDEAHCVSQWGQDFRPSYLEIVKFINLLPQRPVISTFTATATAQVKEDICSILRLNNPYIISTGFDRPNLFFSVLKPKNKFMALIDIINNHKESSGIVYCSTRKNVDSICERLVRMNINAAPYHAGLPENVRKENQEAFIYDKVQIIVATNAFGMGIDKSDVSFIVHYNMPKDLESYYQEAGRAGRDGSDADCCLLYDSHDYHLNLFILKKSYEEGGFSEEILKNNVARLKRMSDYASTNYCLRHFMLDYFGEQSDSYCGKCSNCKKDFIDYDATVDSQKILSCVYRTAKIGKRVGKNTLVKILRGSRAEIILSMKLDTVSTYGIMKNESSEKIIQITDYLINKGYLSVTDGKRPVVYLNRNSAQIIKGEKKIMIRLPDFSKEKRFVFKAEENPSAADPELMKKLKQLRYGLAERESVPAYVIFTNRTLEEICCSMPVTMEEFAAIPNVGSIKLKKYGRIFTDMIAEYKKEKSNLTE